MMRSLVNLWRLTECRSTRWGLTMMGTDRSVFVERLSEAQASVVAPRDVSANETFIAQLEPLASHG